MNQLKKELAAKGLECKGKKKRIHALAKAANIPFKETIVEVLPGWVSQPKGMLQTAFERGMLDPTKIDPRNGSRQRYYTAGRRKDEFRKVVDDSSLCRIFDMMPDFVNEETLLQFHAKNGVTVDHSPIAHPELAGEGVEYDWGFSKLNYRRAPLDEKKNKDKFRKLVRKCISRESITLEMRRKFARRAREYIVAYRALALQRTDDSDPLPTMSASLIEKVVKRSIRPTVTRRSGERVAQKGGRFNEKVNENNRVIWPFFAEASNALTILLPSIWGFGQHFHGPTMERISNLFGRFSPRIPKVSCPPPFLCRKHPVRQSDGRVLSMMPLAGQTGGHV